MKGKILELTNVVLNIVIVVLLVVILFQGQEPVHVTVQVPVEEAAPVEVAAPEPTLKELQNGVPFRFVIVNNQHPIVRIMMLGFFEACENYGLDCEMAGIDGVDTAALLARAEETISLGSSGVVFYPNEAYFEAMKAIKDEGIPIVGIHVPLPEEHNDKLDGWIATDNIDYSVRSADAMAEAVKCEGPIAVTLGGHNEVETPAAEAFTARMQELCPGIEVLKPEEEGFEPAASIAKAAAIIAAHPDVKGAYSTTGAGSTTWATALRDAGKEAGEVAVISMDYSEQNLDWVRDGWVLALVGQPLYEETYAAVEMLVEIMKGGQVEFANDYPAPLIFADDVDQYYAYGERVVERFK